MRRLAIVLIGLGLVILIIVLIIKAIVGGGPSSSTTQTQGVQPLVNYANTDVTMQMTIEGRVDADQSHREVQIAVNSANAQLNIFQGYQRTLLNSSSFANNSNAYADFLRALDLSGYRLGNSNPSLSDDQGYCADGQRYTFEIVQTGQDLQNYWSSTCGEGTFRGNTLEIVDLFERQIPNYIELTNNIDFDM